MTDADIAFAKIPDAIAAIGRGEVVVVVDDEDRENEGDLIMAAEAATPEKIAFFLHHTSGVICAPVTSTVRGLATEVPIGIEAGLAHDSVANFDNTLLLGRHRLVRRLGRASATTMAGVCRALATAAGCP